jgi:7,8-dihydropterin-6-yl-methyl-4-(beta-D-ribofuranosyl)aminobenzene 5'-phosphate synthase
MVLKQAIAPAIALVAAASAVWWLASAGSKEQGKPEPVGEEGRLTQRREAMIDGAKTGPVPLDSLSIVITYDNYEYLDGLTCEWGFSCVVAGPEKTVLFDTGGEGDVLAANIEKLDIDPGDIDVIVLSHDHGDHTGGLGTFLSMNPDVTVYLLESFGRGVKHRARDRASEVVEVSDAVEICSNVRTTGQMGFDIKEESLIVETDAGIIVITGCAHPGIVDIVERARALTGGDVLLVLGGFHLFRASRDRIGDVIAGLRAAGVRYAAPCHCSGEVAREMFRQEFGSYYISAGVGRRLTAADLRPTMP